jgi:predicted methyltransferase
VSAELVVGMGLARVLLPEVRSQLAHERLVVVGDDELSAPAADATQLGHARSIA